jgi:hypothetical protein
MPKLGTDITPPSPGLMAVGYPRRLHHWSQLDQQPSLSQERCGASKWYMIIFNYLAGGTTVMTAFLFVGYFTMLSTAKLDLEGNSCNTTEVLSWSFLGGTKENNEVFQSG